MGTRPVLDFWFELASTYSYLAAMRIEKLAAAAGVEVRWRPFLLGPIFAAQGWTNSPFNLFPAKGRNMWRDLERLCARDGLPLVKPSPFPQNTLSAARLALAGRDAGWLPAFAKAVFRAEFGEGRAISDEAVLTALLREVGADPSKALAAARGEDVKARLKAETELARSIGIFGAPSLVTADGELFWGNDRLEQAIAWGRPEIEAERRTGHGEDDMARSVSETKLVERPFGRLHVEIEGAGPPLVFGHGLGGNHLSWWQQVGRFRDRFTCVTFTHRGFAPSDPVDGGPDPVDYAGDLAAIADALGLDRFAYVGQSMGGWTGLEFAFAWPDRLTALVLACTTGTIDYERAEGLDHAALAAWKADGAAKLAAWSAAGIHVACGERMAREQPAQHLLYRQIDRLSRGLDKETLRRRLFQARKRDPRELARLRVPLLFIAGAEDPVIPALGIEAVARQTPGARVSVVPEAGHSVYFERPALFDGLVAAFLGV